MVVNGELEEEKKDTLSKTKWIYSYECAQSRDLLNERSI